jgi:hypothetical protein
MGAGSARSILQPLSLEDSDDHDDQDQDEEEMDEVACHRDDQPSQQPEEEQDEDERFERVPWHKGLLSVRWIGEESADLTLTAAETKG